MSTNYHAMVEFNNVKITSMRCPLCKRVSLQKRGSRSGDVFVSCTTGRCTFSFKLPAADNHYPHNKEAK